MKESLEKKNNNNSAGKSLSSDSIQNILSIT